eukprot:8379817-Alexandrium_andersonii.AAC.1
MQNGSNPKELDCDAKAPCNGISLSSPFGQGSDRTSRPNPRMPRRPSSTRRGSAKQHPRRPSAGCREPSLATTCPSGSLGRPRA